MIFSIFLRKQEQYWNGNLCVKCLFLCEGIKISYERRSMKMSVHAGRIINDLLQCANFKKKYFQAKAIKIGKNTIFICFNVNFFSSLHFLMIFFVCFLIC